MAIEGGGEGDGRGSGFAQPAETVAIAKAKASEPGRPWFSMFGSLLQLQRCCIIHDPLGMAPPER